MIIVTYIAYIVGIMFWHFGVGMDCRVFCTAKHDRDTFENIVNVDYRNFRADQRFADLASMECLESREDEGICE